MVHPSQLHQYLATAKELALEAGAVILDYYLQQNFQTTQKQDQSPVTEADLQANEIIVNGLKTHFPDHMIISEEGDTYNPRVKSDFIWFVDPLDGTKDFLARNKEFTVNIGLTYKGQPVVGVVYAPALDELYWASHKEGAWWQKNNTTEQIHVSSRKKESELVLVVSRHHLTDQEKEYIRTHHFAEVKQVGSSLKGCLIARGEADRYVRFVPINMWDICAMHCIVEEAGGTITTHNGKSIKYSPAINTFAGIKLIHS